MPFHLTARTILDPGRLAALVDRLEAVTPDAERRWGTMSPGEMLCHLADATDWVQGVRVPAGIRLPARVQWTKWVALYTPVPWPRGFRTKPAFDPRLEGTRPAEFEADRHRAVESLRMLASTPVERLAPAHMIFGPMTRAEWGRWAWRHTDYHLRQFSR